jgi:hypothetical protein
MTRLTIIAALVAFVPVLARSHAQSGTAANPFVPCRI